MTHDDLTTLLDYHYWARDRVLEAADRLTAEQLTRDLGSSFKSVRETLVHLYSAEWVWHQRFHGTSPTAMPSMERFPDTGSIRQAWTELEGQMRAYLAGQDDAALERGLDYRTLAGVASSSFIRDILQHVVNHGSYHRGQLTTMFRQLGTAPAKSMDLIAFYRERRGAA